MLKEFLFILAQMAANIVQAITGFAGGPLAMPPSIALVGVDNAKAATTLICWIATIVMTAFNYKYVAIGFLVGTLVGVIIIVIYTIYNGRLQTDRELFKRLDMNKKKIT